MTDFYSQYESGALTQAVTSQVVEGFTALPFEYHELRGYDRMVELSTVSEGTHVLYVPATRNKILDVNYRVVDMHPDASLFICEWSDNHLSHDGGSLVVDTDQGNVHFIKNRNTGFVSNLDVRNMLFSNMRRVWFRPNTYSSWLDGITFDNCEFNMMRRPPLAFNGVAGLVSDVRLSHLNFTGDDDSQMVVGIQASNVVCDHLEFYGMMREAIHVEQTAENVEINHPKIEASIPPNGAAIRVVDNDVNGTAVTPELITITGGKVVNMAQLDGQPAKHGVGVQFVHNGDPGPVKDASLLNVEITGFNHGVLNGAQMDDNTHIRRNRIHGNTVGYRALNVGANFTHNYLWDNFLNVEHINGGSTAAVGTLLNQYGEEITQ